MTIISSIFALGFVLVVFNTVEHTMSGDSNVYTLKQIIHVLFAMPICLFVCCEIEGIFGLIFYYSKLRQFVLVRNFNFLGVGNVL